MKKNIVIIYILIFCIFIIPTGVLAKNTKKAGIGTNSGTTADGTMAEATESNLAYGCFNYYLNMNISVGKYKREARYDGGGNYTNYVHPRTITVSNSSGGSFKALIYHGPIGSLDDLKNLTPDEIKKYNDDADEDADDGEEGNEIKVKTIKMKTAKTKSWDLPAGEEALVIYLNNSKKKAVSSSGSAYVYRGSCSKTNDDGACVEWHTVSFECPKGKLDAKKSSAEQPVMTGNAVSLFVENPYDSGKVQNFRKVNESEKNACYNAWNGIYDGEDTEKETYNVKAEDLETWRNNYYNKILSDCNESYVDFNLNEKHIKELSNGLLRTFYYNNQIDKLKAEGKIKDLTTINGIAGDLEHMIRLKYQQLGENSSGHIIKGNDRDLTTSLSCKYKNNVVDSSVKTIDEEYLYVTDEKKIKAEITKTNVGVGRKTKKIDVCSTKCYEHLTVKYDVPQAVKAGLCFSYKVTVKSKAECGIEVYDYWSELKKPDTCAPVAICENDDNHTQAGPNEDFDNCINACDGGKYTQSCINSCYNKAYKSNNKNKSGIKKNSNTNIKAEVSGLVHTFDYYNSATLEKVAQKYTDSQLRDYYTSPISDCSTTDKIDSHKDICAEYFFEAKALYPYGTYGCYYTDCSPNHSKGGGNLKWISNFSNSNGIVESAIGVKGSSIPMQIGRASPFYLRDKASTKELLTDLIGRYKNNVWYKYVINTQGFKQQYSARWICYEKCSFTGCTDDDDKVVSDNIAYTSGEFSNNLIKDLNSIQEALSKCNASTACDTEEKETEYEMKITSHTTDGNSKTGGSEGNTTLYQQEGSSNFIDGNETKSFFVQRDVTDTPSGILGLCYDRRDEPHYQTTITYPGTSINYKTGERIYDNPGDPIYYLKDKYYCTPYNEANVNEKYWYWGVIQNYNRDLYPTGFSPTYNIEANLGKSGYGFGKYNWKINFKCFYSSYNSCGDDECKTIPSCPVTDPNYPTCTPGTTDTCKSEYDCPKSTRFTNAEFRVVDSENLFPNSSGGHKSGRKELNEEIPYNWTSAAQDTNPKDGGDILMSRGYGVNPEEYRKEIEANPTKWDDASDYEAMYHIKLSKQNINDLKQYVKNNGYDTYPGYGESNQKPYTISGTNVSYYRMPDSFTSEYMSYFRRNTELGVNGR